MNTAPNFSLPASDGSTVSLESLRGQPVVLYFYPRDATPGCTTEARDFRDKLSEFEKHGASVFGISQDNIASHQRFAAKQELNFALLSDEDGSVCEAYGVLKEKTNFGKRYIGIERSTFLIDADGRIAREWRKVKVPGHVDEVLEATRQL